MMSKEEKQRLKKLYRNQVRLNFEESLPMCRVKFKELFEFLDINLSEEACDETLKFSLEFLKQISVQNLDDVVNWLNENGGYCDCEVLANIEEQFEN